MLSNTCKAKLAGLGLMGAIALGIYALVFRPWHLRWGATPDETNRSLPGDDLVPHPKQLATRAVTIHAGTAEIWPWLVQIGQGRGGFYSYDFLENLIGCDIHSADRILPEHQQLNVGDQVRLGREGYPFYTVAAVEPEHFLLLRSGLSDQDAPQPAAPVEDVWLFYLDEIEPGVTRLIARNRRDYEPSAGNFIVWQVITEPLHFLMEQKMLRGIKQRVEGVWNHGCY